MIQPEEGKKNVSLSDILREMEKLGAAHIIALACLPAIAAHILERLPREPNDDPQDGEE